MEFRPYISCIKIKGVPILPPLVTPERRKELQEYRNQALSLEDLYNNRKLTRKKYVENLEEDCRVIDKPTDEMQNHCSNESNLVQVLKDIVSPVKYVPYVEEKKKMLNLSTDLIDVSEYSSSTNINRGVIESDQHDTTSGIDLDESFSDEELRKRSEASCSSDINTELQKPRLIRSNSYTLDNPSPLLLAHLERQKSDSSSTDNTVTDRHLLDHERIPEDMLNFVMEKSSSGIQETQSGDTVKINTVTPLQPSMKDLDYLKNNSKAPIVEVMTTDITVQQINITTSIDEKIEQKDIMEMMNNNDSEKKPIGIMNDNTNTDPIAELQLVLQQIPEIYSKKIIELIERQKLEQSKRIENYEKMKEHLLQFEDNQNENVHVGTPTKIFVTSNPQPSVPENMFTGRMVISPEVETQNVGDTRLSYPSLNESLTLMFDMSTSCSESLEDSSLKTVKIVDYSPIKKSNGNVDEITKVSQIRSSVSDRRAKEEKAASVICAYARGYLVRRLMKTTKVQRYIQTIQEALICALEMQDSDTIEEADVELHRRLIQQISATCYEFHDVFFALTIPEQMELIALDREQKKRAFIIRTRSVADFSSRKQSNTNARLTKSLTKM